MADEISAFAPGRVNLIGEHTDYNRGLALPFAIREGVTVTARPAGAPRIEASAIDLGEHDAFALDAPEPAEGWRAFVRGAVGELARAGIAAERRSAGHQRHRAPGRRPLLVGRARGRAHAWRCAPWRTPSRRERIELAQLCARIENEWVGAQTGLLDQLASLFGEEQRAVRIDFDTLDRRVRGPRARASHTLITLDSGESPQPCHRRL